jgi:hypothetical protein
MCSLAENHHFSAPGASSRLGWQDSEISKLGRDGSRFVSTNFQNSGLDIATLGLAVNRSPFERPLLPETAQISLFTRFPHRRYHTVLARRIESHFL